MPEPLEMTYDQFAQTNWRIARDWLLDLGYPQPAIDWAEKHQGEAIDLDHEYYDAWSELGDTLEFVAFVMKRLVASVPERDATAELVKALKALYRALRERHHGRMPDEVRVAYEGAYAALAAVGEEP